MHLANCKLQIADAVLVPTLCVGTEDLAARRRRGAMSSAKRPGFTSPRRAWERGNRQGGVYIAVLGSAMIIALLGLCALIGQRIENRLVSASADIRQAQLNASTAVELALLTMKQDTNWRSTYSNGNWFTNRSTGIGTCTANVVDPVDSSLSNNPDDPVVVTGIGYSGQAQQRLQVTVDTRKTPLTSLRSAIAAGGVITLSSDTFRTNGLITANQVSASSSQVYGNVQATSISGSTYNGTNTQVTSDKLPKMPDWTSVFNYYRTNGAQIDIASVPSSTPNLGLNVAIESGTTSWSGNPPLASIGTSAISQDNTAWHVGTNPGTNSLKVQTRQNWSSGPIQRIDSFVKPGGSYYIEAWVYIGTGLARNFCVTLYTKGTANGAASFSTGPSVFVALGALNVGWTKISATLPAPAWSGNLEYAFVKIAGADSLNTATFNMDDLLIQESATGRFIYRKVMGPGVNTLYAGAPTNSEGIYVINCNGNRLIIEHSRIVGTLLILNPGANSCVNDGPIAWQPAVAGYPALLVDADNATSADFAINATNHILSEKDDGINYNQTGAPHDELGTNVTMTDIYRSQIRGLIAIRHDFAFQNRALLRGPVIVGNNITNSTGELEVNYLPDSLLNPPSGFWSYTYPRRTSSIQKAVLP